MSIAWQKRPDLQITTWQSGDRRAWGVKDPVALSYFELRDEEYFVLSQLERPVTVDELCTRFNARFPSQTLAPAELERFLGQLVQQGLLIAGRPGYGQVLVERAASAHRQRRWLGLTNILAIRFRGIDPDPMLTWMVARFAWLFSPWAVAAGSLLVGSAIVLVVVQFEELVKRLPETYAWLGIQNLLLIAGVFAVVKVLHEMGHGLACKRFGGECHEMGIMLLVFTPTLYCNVSDIWMIENKWRRMAVGAAGIWVESLLAASCTFLWWFSVPGLFHSLCLNLMLVCGISTLIFNGNPLLRYDGYFILSDYLEIPNLHQQATAAMRRRLTNWLFGVAQQAARPVSLRREGALAIYGVASTVWRIALTFSILWLVYSWLQPRGLGAVAQAFAVLTIGLMVAGPCSGMLRWLRTPALRSQVRWVPFWFKAGFTCLILAAIGLAPLPGRVSTAALFDTDEAARIYVTAEGTLVDSVRPGSTVVAGQELVRLTDPQLERELARLDGNTRAQRVQLDQLERRRIHEPAAAVQIPTVREGLRDAEEQFAQRQRDAERLVLRSPRDGIVLPPPSQPQLRAQPGALPYWSSSPLEERNRGCFLTAGTTACLVVDQSRPDATLVINQDDVNLIRVGQSVRLSCVEYPGEILTGEIVELAGLELDLLTTDLIRRARLPTRITSAGSIKPVGKWYQARVRLSPTDLQMLPGTVGEGTILIEPRSLFTRLSRWIRRTFALGWQR